MSIVDRLIKLAAARRAKRSEAPAARNKKMRSGSLGFSARQAEITTAYATKLEETIHELRQQHAAQYGHGMGVLGHAQLARIQRLQRAARRAPEPFTYTGPIDGIPGDRMMAALRTLVPYGETDDSRVIQYVERHLDAEEGSPRPISSIQSGGVTFETLDRDPETELRLRMEARFGASVKLPPEEQAKQAARMIKKMGTGA